MMAGQVKNVSFTSLNGVARDMYLPNLYLEFVPK